MWELYYSAAAVIMDHLKCKLKWTEISILEEASVESASSYLLHEWNVYLPPYHWWLRFFSTYACESMRGRERSTPDYMFTCGILLLFPFCQSHMTPPTPPPSISFLAAYTLAHTFSNHRQEIVQVHQSTHMVSLSGLGFDGHGWMNLELVLISLNQQH